MPLVPVVSVVAGIFRETLNIALALPALSSELACLVCSCVLEEGSDENLKVLNHLSAFHYQRHHQATSNQLLLINIFILSSCS